MLFTDCTLVNCTTTTVDDDSDDDGVSVMFRDCTLTIVTLAVALVNDTLINIDVIEDDVIEDDVIDDDVIEDDVIDDDVTDDDVTMLLVVLMGDNVVVDNITLAVLVVLATVLMFTGELVDSSRDDVAISIELLIVVVERTDSSDVTSGVELLTVVVVNVGSNTIIVVGSDIELTGSLNCELLEDNIPDPSGDVKIPVEMEDVCNNSVDSVKIASDDSTEGVGETKSERSEKLMLSIVNSSSLRFVVTLSII